MRSYLKLYKSYIRKRVQKVRKEQIENVYDDQPRITAIVQVFNKRKVISKLIRRLQSLPIAELIVIDDGSIDGTWKEAFPLLNRKNDFLLRSNDLFEVRMYDRALTLARGKFAILLQDDDLPPETFEWIENAIQLFENDEKLLILGGRDGLTILPPDPI
ncbi:MAG: glycosyltransferase family 2 protein, partial [Anaerolineales bacterium]